MERQCILIGQVGSLAHPSVMTVAYCDCQSSQSNMDLLGSSQMKDSCHGGQSNTEPLKGMKTNVKLFSRNCPPCVIAIFEVRFICYLRRNVAIQTMLLLPIYNEQRSYMEKTKRNNILLSYTFSNCKIDILKDRHVHQK